MSRPLPLLALLALACRGSTGGSSGDASDAAADRARYLAALKSRACATVADPALQDDCRVATAKAPADCPPVHDDAQRGECWFRVAEKTADASLCPRAVPYADDCALHVLSHAFVKAIPKGTRPGEHEDVAVAQITAAGLAVTDMRPWSAWYRWVLGGTHPLDRAACDAVPDPARREACSQTGLALYQDLLNNARDRHTWPCDGGPLPPALAHTPDPAIDALVAARTDLCSPR